MSQKKVFLNKEGDNWFKRNHENFTENKLKSDPIVKFIKKQNFSFKNILEIGCSSGYRLNYLKKYTHKGNYFGIDPSKEAIEHGKKKFKNISLKIGTADNLEFDNQSFDLLIFGFCLYLCDRSDLFKISFEADRVLKKKGLIIIYDFYSKNHFSNKYKHTSGIKSYKMNYSKLFLCNPNYFLLEKKIFKYNLKSKLSLNNKLGLFVIEKKL